MVVSGVGVGVQCSLMEAAVSGSIPGVGTHFSASAFITFSLAVELFLRLSIHLT